MAIGGKKFLLDTEYAPPCLRIEIFIGSPDSKLTTLQKIEGVLLDTGSDLTLIPNNIIKALKLKMIGTKELENFNGQIVPVKYYLAKIIIDDVVNDIVEIGGIDSEAMIGMDLIKEWHILMNGPQGTFEIANKSNYKFPIQHKIK